MNSGMLPLLHNNLTQHSRVCFGCCLDVASTFICGVTCLDLDRKKSVADCRTVWNELKDPGGKYLVGIILLGCKSGHMGLQEGTVLSEFWKFFSVSALPWGPML